jgi:cyclohexanecarboxyl-CoA dehydrogenase
MKMFEFSEQDKMLRNQVRDFARKELAPGAKKRAKTSEIPGELWNKIADLGYTGLGVPEKYGGQESSWVTRGVVIEELGYADVNIGGLTHHVQNMAWMASQGKEELAAEWVPAFVRTEKVCCAAISEPDCGADVAAIKTRATRDGDDYIINGEKTSVSRGTYADACLVLAKTNPDAGIRGLTQFLVPLNLPGIEISALHDMGCLAVGRAIINFNNVRIPAKNRISEEGQAFAKAFVAGIDKGRALTGLAVLAAAQASVDETIAFTKERYTFGKPIAKYEGVSFKIAEAATYIEAARWFCYYTLWLGDQNRSSYKEGSMCKWWCPQLAVKIIHDCVLLHGHIGYTDELPLEQRMRDVIGYEYTDGTAEINKLNIVREIMGKDALPYK